MENRTLTTRQRVELMDALIDGEVNTNAGDGDWYLRDLLRNGFEGYTNMSDKDLISMAESASIPIPEGE
jgi:hypothetical protein